MFVKLALNSVKVSNVLNIFLLLFSLYPELTYAASSTITSGPNLASPDLTYAPTIVVGENTNITTYDNGFKWAYTLHTFTVCSTGIYTASSTTTPVINTTFFLTETFLPSITFPPATPISNFFISSFSGNKTALFTALNLSAGQLYSVLIVYDEQNSPPAPNLSSVLTIDGPGEVKFNGIGSCFAGGAVQQQSIIRCGKPVC